MKNLNEVIKETAAKVIGNMLDVETYGWPVCIGLLYQPERPDTEEV